MENLVEVFTRLENSNSSPTPLRTTPFPSMRFRFHRSLDFFHLSGVDVLLIWIQCRRALIFINQKKRRRRNFFGSKKVDKKKRRWKKSFFMNYFDARSRSWRRNIFCRSVDVPHLCVLRAKHEDDNFVLNFWWRDKKCMSELILRGSWRPSEIFPARASNPSTECKFLRSLRARTLLLRFIKFNSFGDHRHLVPSRFRVGGL